MGCDIHIHVEVFRKSQNKWQCADYFRINPFYSKNPEENDEGEKEYELVDFCGDRNYSRFAVLADVRNYGETQYISRPKGLPYDVSEQVRADSEGWSSDGHSHSFLTLKELIDFQNAGIKLRSRGMISPEAQRQLDENGVLPNSYCQWTNIPGWQVREWEEENHVLDPLIDALKDRADDFYLIYRWEWERDPEKAYAQSDSIRIVFWFDN